MNAAGSCFDVFDSTQDQHYDPSRPTYASMAAAVDATWATLAHKQGQIFATYYNAGQPNEACGAGANGWQMFQWGTQACGLDGRTAAQIMGDLLPRRDDQRRSPGGDAGAGHARADPDRRAERHASTRPRRRAPARPPRPRRPPHLRRRQHRLPRHRRSSCPAVARLASPRLRRHRHRIRSRSSSASARRAARASKPRQRALPRARPRPRVDIAEMRDHAVVRFERTADAAAYRSRVTPVRSVPATLRLLVMRQLIERVLAELPMGVRPGS